MTVKRLFKFNQFTCKWFVLWFIFDPLTVFFSSVSEGPVNGEEQDKHDPVLSDLCSQEVLSHGSSEDLLSDYDYLPVEIG